MIKDPFTETGRLAFRLAFRKEGEMWNAYYAVMDTMEGAIWLGSIQMKFVQNEKRREAFRALMRECFSDVVEQLMGQRPTWPEPEGHPAPEHERTKE